MLRREESYNNELKQKGITLVTLTITIIVLLILAGVTLNTLFKDSGILSNSAKAKENAEISSEKEIIGQANIIAAAQSKTGEITVEEMQEAINQTTGKEIATAINNGETIAIKFNESNRYYFVDEDANIEGPIDIVFDATPGELSGIGTEADPFIIMSIEDLVYFSQQVNVNKNTYSGKYVALGKTLDFNSELSYIDYNTTEYDEYLGGNGTTGLKKQLTKGNGFIAIGNDLNGTEFQGIFDGKNNEIKNLYMNNTTLTYLGLFGIVNSAKIKDLGVTGKIISSKDNVYIAGVVGSVTSKNVIISNCYSKVEIKDYAPTSGYIGGIVARTTYTVTIENCYNGGNIETEKCSIGGIIGTGSNTIKNCENKANLKTTNGYCGGIMGYGNYNAFTIENCTNKGNITSANKSAGGICGHLILNSGINSITHSKNEGNVSGQLNVGGIVGTKEFSRNIHNRKLL